MDAKRLAEIKESYADIIPGPWTADIDDPLEDGWWTGKMYVGAGDDEESWCWYPASERLQLMGDDGERLIARTMRFVAMARTVVPELVEDVLEARRIAAELMRNSMMGSTSYMTTDSLRKAREWMDAEDAATKKKE